MPAVLGAAMPARGSGVLDWPEFVTVALSGLVPEYLIPPDRSRTGAVIDGEPEERTEVEDVELITIFPFVAVNAVVPESVTDVPDEFSTRRAAVEYAPLPEPTTALAVADIFPAPQIALKSLGDVSLTET